MRRTVHVNIDEAMHKKIEEMRKAICRSGIDISFINASRILARKVKIPNVKGGLDEFRKKKSRPY